jgi:hypothetical protein
MSKYKKLISEATEHRSGSMRQDTFNVRQLRQMEALVTDRSAASTKVLSPLLGKYKRPDSIGNQINKIISKLYTGLGSIPKRSGEVTNHVLNMVDKITNEKATASMSDMQIIYNELESAHYKLKSEQSTFNSEKAVLNMAAKDTMLVKMLGDVELATITRQVDRLSKLDMSLLANHMHTAAVTMQQQEVETTFNAIENFHRDLQKMPGNDVIALGLANESEFYSTLRVFRSLWLYLYGCVQLARETNAINPDETDTKTTKILKKAIKNLATAEERLLGRETFNDPAMSQIGFFRQSEVYDKAGEVCLIHSGMLESFESTGYPSFKVYTTSRIKEIDLTPTTFDASIYDIKETPIRDIAKKALKATGKAALTAAVTPLALGAGAVREVGQPGYETGRFAMASAATSIAAATEAIYAAKGAIEGSGKALGGALSATGGVLFGVGATVGAVALGSGVTLAGIVGTAPIALGAASLAYYQNRRELKKLAMSDPTVVEAARNEILSKLRERESQRGLRTTQREERALQLEIHMLDLGAQRLRHLMVQAKLEAKAADADERAAVARAGEAEINLIEGSINLAAEKLQTELAGVTRGFERSEAKLDRQETSDANRAVAAEERAARTDTEEGLKLDLRDHKRKMILFKNKHFGKTLDSRAQNQQTKLKNEEANILQKIRRTRGEF